MNLDTKYPLVDHFEIATRIIPDSCLCLHSAFKMYGLGNQAYFEVYINSPKIFDDFTYFNVNFTHIPIATLRKITKIRSISVTSIEQTIVDSIADLEKYCELEEVLRCFEHLHGFSEICLDDLLYEPLHNIDA